MQDSTSKTDCSLLTCSQQLMNEQQLSVATNLLQQLDSILLKIVIQITCQLATNSVYRGLQDLRENHVRCHIGRIAHAHMHIARIVSYSASAAACRYAANAPLHGQLMCCVGCQSKQGHCNYSFHRFPKEKSRRKQWVTAIRRECQQPTEYSRICGAILQLVIQVERSIYRSLHPKVLNFSMYLLWPRRVALLAQFETRTSCILYAQYGG